MKPHPLFKYLYIDDFSATPKYYQLANSIVQSIVDGKLQQDDILPSINEVSYAFEISRDTAEKAYKHLKSIGVLGSVPGKGYYVQNTRLGQPFRILLLFNKLSEHKKIIYDSFAEKLGEHANIDFFIYNSDFSLFKKLLSEKAGDYTHVVVLPHFRERWEHVDEVLNAVPKEKLVLLDKKLKGVTGEYAAVYENFREDIYDALEQMKERLQRYGTIKLIYPDNTYYPAEIQEGFISFCQTYAFPYAVVSDVSQETVSAGNVYLNIREGDLVALMEKIIAQGLQVGRDIGLISYNETPLKKFLLNGITTISTDFRAMGEMAAQTILDRSKAQIEVPFRVNLRPSL
ncbi:GntR family transcriptional regulator [Chitinophaga lutea]